jgi:RNA polymerase sigma factor (sigma-70 family)
MGKIIFKYQPSIESLTDMELVAAYKNSLDTRYIGQLFQRYQHIVTGVCLKYLRDIAMANDASLELFNNLFANLIKYEVHDFKSWLLTITRNYCTRILKEQARTVRMTPVFENSLQNVADDYNEPEPGLHEILLSKLETGMASLKPEQETCIRLFYIDGLSYDEISLQTGYNLNKVKSYIQNGKRNLQIMLQEYRQSEFDN